MQKLVDLWAKNVLDRCLWNAGHVAEASSDVFSEISGCDTWVSACGKILGCGKLSECKNNVLEPDSMNIKIPYKCAEMP
jgi:hypothetical protein